MCTNHKDKNSVLKIIFVAALAAGALAGMVVTFVYFVKKFKLKLSMATPCDDCLADDCCDCDYASDFDEADVDDVEVAQSEEKDVGNTDSDAE